MTPERRKELEERAREWLADHVMHVKVTGYDSILSLLEAVDREAEERGRREVFRLWSKGEPQSAEEDARQSMRDFMKGE